MALVQGKQVNPDFPVQVRSAIGFVADVATGFIRLGLVDGSGAGVASAASSGNIRGARNNGIVPGFQVFTRNDADTQDQRFLTVDSLADQWSVGGLGANDNTAGLVQARTSLTLRIIDAAHTILVSGASVIVGPALTAIAFNHATLLPFFTVSPALAGDANTGNGTQLGFQGQSTGVSAKTAGAGAFLGGDATGSGTGTGADVFLDPGNGTSVQGNAVFQVRVSPAWNSMENGSFWGLVTTLPVGNPTNGHYAYVDAGARMHRAPSGGVTMVSAP